MRLKMLIGMSGNGFVLDPGEVTERFADTEAKRLIANGYAEKAAPIVKPKPATKQEWDEERDALLAENDRLMKELADALAKAGDEVIQSAAFKKFCEVSASAFAELNSVVKDFSKKTELPKGLAADKSVVASGQS